MEFGARECRSMNPPSTVPEYILEALDETLDTGNLRSCSDLDLDQVVVELVQLSKACSLLEDLAVSIGNHLQVLVRSLPEQV